MNITEIAATIENEILTKTIPADDTYPTEEEIEAILETTLEANGVTIENAATSGHSDGRTTLDFSTDAGYIGITLDPTGHYDSIEAR